MTPPPPEVLAIAARGWPSRSAALRIGGEEVLERRAGEEAARRGRWQETEPGDKTERERKEKGL